jgi:hypothetical protein
MGYPPHRLENRTRTEEFRRQTPSRTAFNEAAFGKVSRFNLVVEPGEENGRAATLDPAIEAIKADLQTCSQLRARE